MKTIQELQNEINDLQAVVDNPSTAQQFRDKAQAAIITKLEELNKLQEQAQSQPDSSAGTAPVSVNRGDAVQEALMAIRNMMLSAPSGSGANSDEVNKMIEAYLSSQKVNITQIDKSVLEFIKQNQKVEIQVPSIGLKVEMSNADAQIPNIFTMLDDIFAGNNIYMIGEAGAGKTYAAERICSILKRERVTINCSQYTSPTEIIGGQTIEGYKEGKLIRAWRDGKILILDEMPRLDPNTAGLFNDALAKSSHTREPQDAAINSSNPEEPPVPRNNKFGLIATGNVYPNTTPDQQYGANNQQDLSLLDRFSGSVYSTGYAKPIDADNCRYQFIYDICVGNYYEYLDAAKKNQTKPEPKGLRTVLTDLKHLDKAVISYRTCSAFRIAFEIELVRAIYYAKNPESVKINGKTLVKAFNSFMVAFSPDVKDALLLKTKFTDEFLQLQVDNAIKMFTSGNEKDWLKTLIPSEREKASKILEKQESIKLADGIVIN